MSTSLGELNGTSIHAERVAILDAGAQYGKVIDRRIRELNCDSEIIPLSTATVKDIQDQGFKYVVASDSLQRTN